MLSESLAQMRYKYIRLSIGDIEKPVTYGGMTGLASEEVTMKTVLSC